jgi:hypothetical protein
MQQPADARFPRDTRPRIVGILDRHRGTTDIVMLTSRRAVRRYL